jgi:hypothetical protein
LLFNNKIAKMAPPPRFTPGDVIGAKSLRMVSVSPKQHSVFTPGEIVDAAPKWSRAGEVDEVFATIMRDRRPRA